MRIRNFEVLGTLRGACSSGLFKGRCDHGRTRVEPWTLVAAKMTNERLLRSEAYLAEAQRLSHTGNWAFNARGPVYWSEENFRIWGLDPQQGLPDRELVLQRIHPEDRDRVLEHVLKAVRDKQDYAAEFRIVLPGEKIKYIQGLGHPVFSANGDLREVVGTQGAVTERKRDD